LRIDPVEDLGACVRRGRRAGASPAHRLKALGLIDKIVSEPVGGAHRDTKQMAAFLTARPQ